MAARSQQFQTEQIDIFISACSFFRMLRGRCKFWRVENDEIKTFCLIAQFSQRQKNISIQPLCTRGILIIIDPAIK